MGLPDDSGLAERESERRAVRTGLAPEAAVGQQVESARDGAVRPRDNARPRRQARSARDLPHLVREAAPGFSLQPIVPIPLGPRAHAIGGHEVGLAAAWPIPGARLRNRLAKVARREARQAKPRDCRSRVARFGSPASEKAKTNAKPVSPLGIETDPRGWLAVCTVAKLPANSLRLRPVSA